MGKRLYAYSIKTTRVREPDFPYNGKSLTCTTELVDFARILSNADNENFLSILLDAQNKVIGIYRTEGIANQNVVYPRAVLRQALLVNASAIIMIHNHPSGHVRPSDADVRLTRTIKEAAQTLDILIHDHIILGEERFFSFREEGMMS